MGEPFRINVCGEASYSDEEGLTFVEYCMKAGFNMVEPIALHDRKLAVVGGGLSLSRHIHELKNFDGDIWAVNGTGNHLSKHGIKYTFITVDGSQQLTDELLELWTQGTNDFLISSAVCPKLVDKIKNKNVRVFHIDSAYGDNPINGGSTTACRTPELAMMLGYTDITYFGCDSSYEERTHIDRNAPQVKDMLIVRADGKDYKTNLQMLNQAEYLSAIIRDYGTLFHCKSEGLLPAMIKDDQWEMVAFSSPMHDKLVANGVIENNKQLYEV